MRRELFDRIRDDLVREVPWLRQQVDARGRVGFTTLQKMTVAIRFLGYDTTSDSFDDYLQMSERTLNTCVLKFRNAIAHLYEHQYLRKPNASDVQQLYAVHKAQ
jgi:glycyl-tRNA synthetase alpha subunit